MKKCFERKDIGQKFGPCPDCNCVYVLAALDLYNSNPKKYTYLVSRVESVEKLSVIIFHGFSRYGGGVRFSNEPDRKYNSYRPCMYKVKE